MRVIGGKYRGFNLMSSKGDQIRPTKGMVKENIFNLISDYVVNGAFLDLFCGSGALGIEALSRGAYSCVFSDINPLSVKTTNSNLQNIGLTGEVLLDNWESTISLMQRQNRKFDVIFVDPPYDKINLNDVLFAIFNKDLLNESGIIVVERSIYNEKNHVPKGLYQVDCRKYGKTIVCIYAKGHAVAITGTFDPFTIGHQYLVEVALNYFKSVHIVILNNPEKANLTEKMGNKRVRSISQIVKRLDRKIKVNFFEGLTVDYCKKYDIKYILRGLRDEKDLTYEKTMADLNFQMGKVETYFVMARDSDISSTKVRDMLSKGQDVSLFLPKE